MRITLLSNMWKIRINGVIRKTNGVMEQTRELHIYETEFHTNYVNFLTQAGYNIAL